MKKKIAHEMSSFVGKLVRSDPLLGSVGHRLQHEGNQVTLRTFDGIVDSFGFEEVGGELEIRRDEIVRDGPAAYFKRLENIAEDIVRQQHQGLFRKLDTITERTGNVISGRGQPMTYQMLLEMYETVQIDFDEFGRPELPAMVVAPQMYEALMKRLPEWQSEPTFQRRFAEIMSKKHEDWLDRESNRKLVD